MCTSRERQKISAYRKTGDRVIDGTLGVLTLAVTGILYWKFGGDKLGPVPGGVALFVALLMFWSAGRRYNTGFVDP